MLLKRFAFSLLDKYKDEEIPTCVKLALADSIGILFNDESTPLSELIKIDVDIPHIEETPYNKNDLANIARFVNARHHTWRTKNVLKALEHIFSIDEAAKSGKVEDLFKIVFEKGSECGNYIGPKTNLNPMNHDAVMLFTAMEITGSSEFILLNNDTTEFDMFNAIAFNFTKTYCRSEQAKHFISSHRDCDCPKPNEPERIKCVEDALNRIIPAGPSITSSPDVKEYILNLIVPTSPGDTISLAAVFFNIDLSYTDCPILEFYKILADEKFVEDKNRLGDLSWYSPASINSKFAILFKACPFTFDIRDRWTSTFSKLYTKAQLEFFAKKEGFEIVNNEDILSTITGDETPASHVIISSDDNYKRTMTAYPTAESALSNMENKIGTVMVGWHPSVSNSKSPFSLEDLESDNNLGEEGILSFGTPLGGGMTAFLITDIVAMFDACGAYVITDTDGLYIYISGRMIRKLRRICSERAGVYRNRIVDGSGRHITQTASEAYLELSRVMDRVDSRNLNLTEHSRKIARLIDADPESKEECRKVLILLLEAGMYMRGWKVTDSTKEYPHKYPLDTDDTTFSHEDGQECIDVNVTLSICAYDEAIANMNNVEVRILLRSAPLLKISESMRFIPTISKDQGFTIEDRLAIIRDGEDGSVFSCLRMSSNLIVSSAYYYMVSALQDDPLFDITKLSFIT